MPHASLKNAPLVGLYATCLVDLFRPAVGFAAVRLLEAAGCRVVVPAQTCCGQPAFNSGDKQDAKKLARLVMKAFADVDYTVIPSGSCAGMMARHYEELFSDEPDFLPQVRTFSQKCFELCAFLYDVMGIASISAIMDVSCEGSATYHDSCSGLRELGIKNQPRALLSGVKGLTLTEMRQSEVCCGFGGLFCVKYPEISTAIVSEKTQDIAQTNADMLLAGDLGCLMNIAGRLSREGSPIAVRHIAEVLAGAQDTAPLCQPSQKNSAGKV